VALGYRKVFLLLKLNFGTKKNKKLKKSYPNVEWQKVTFSQLAAKKSFFGKKKGKFSFLLKNAKKEEKKSFLGKKKGKFSFFLKMKMKIFFLNENFPFFLKRKMKIFLSF
jgi:hypothetical protein